MSSFNLVSHLKLRTSGIPADGYEKDEDDCTSLCSVQDNVWFASNNGIIGVLKLGESFKYISSYNTEDISDLRSVVAHKNNKMIGYMSSHRGDIYSYDSRMKSGGRFCGIPGKDIYSLTFPELFNTNIICSGCEDNDMLFWDLRKASKPLVQLKTPNPWHVKWFGGNQPIACISSDTKGTHVLKFNRTYENYSIVSSYVNRQYMFHYTDILPAKDPKESPYFCSLTTHGHQMNIWYIPDYK